MTLALSRDEGEEIEIRLDILADLAVTNPALLQERLRQPIVIGVVRFPKRETVMLGFDAADEVRIYRRELLERRQHGKEST